MEGNGEGIMKNARRSAQAVNVAFKEAPFRLQSSSDETHLVDMKDNQKNQSVCLTVGTFMCM